MKSRGTITAIISMAMLSFGFAGTMHRSPSNTTTGVTYYVSTRGNNASSGLSPHSAFRTISRCAQVLAPGDTCEIMGGTYRETVTPAQSGTPSEPITYRPFHHQRVVVNGTDLVSGWQQVTPGQLPGLAQSQADPFLPNSPFAAAVQAGDIYATHVALNPSLMGNEVFYQGQRLIPAQWPWPGYHQLTPHIEYAQNGTSNTQIVDPNLTQPAGYWNGAQVYTERWFASRTTTVSSSSPGVLDFSGLTAGPPLVPGSTRYYLFGQLKMLSHPGEWYYDPTSQILYMWAPNGQSPQHHAVEVKQRTYAFDLNNVSYTDVIGLRVFGATVQTGTSTTGDVLNGLNVQYPVEYQTLSGPYEWTYGIGTGVVIQGQGNTFENSIIAHSAGGGVALLGSQNVVSGNVIYDVDTMGTYASGVTILGGPDQTVVHNTIFRTGRSAIDIFSPGTNHIAYNNLYAFNRLNVDGGAIYTGFQNLGNTSFDHNWLHDATPMPEVYPWGEAGLYLDTGGYNALIYDNVGWNDPSSTIFIHSPTGSPVAQVYNNDGGVTLLGVNNGVGTNIINNIGGVNLLSGSAQGANINHNLSASVNPDYVNPSAADYQLQPNSPARNSGLFIPGITVGGTDPTPSMGAYQYGAPFWQAGVVGLPLTLVSVTATPTQSNLAPGQTTSISLAGTMSNGSSANLTEARISYEVSNPKVASVSPTGVVTGEGAGAATITVYVVLGGFASIATITVTVS